MAAMRCCPDCIDGVNMQRAGGTPLVFDEVYAPPWHVSRAAYPKNWTFIVAQNDSC